MEPLLVHVQLQLGSLRSFAVIVTQDVGERSGQSKAHMKGRQVKVLGERTKNQLFG